MDPIIGLIALFPYSPGFKLKGWALCDGRTLKVNDYQALYSLLGQRFGGDYGKTFGVPNLPPILSGKEPVAYYIALEGIYPERDD